MFRKNYIVKINLPGGIVATGDLYAIVEAAERAKVTEMQFGARQQLFCKVADRYGADFLQELEAAGVFFETGKECYPNIISSYVTEGVFSKSPWVSEGLYKDILEGFDYRPTLKINLVESSQSLVPFLTGHLNFISSTLNNHWHLVVRRPGTNEQYSWKTAIYSPDIPRVSRLIGEELVGLPVEGGKGAGNAGAEEGWGERLYGTVQSKGLFPVGPVAPAPRLPSFRLPYYEGFNRYENKHWLGIYRREELFPLSFLKDLSLICGKTKIGQLYTTPWKSLLIKGIEEQDLPLWEYVLGKYRMNVRHASNELNWQMEDFSPEGLRLKRYLVRQLDQDDIRTEGLSFSIKIRRGSGLSGSIIIRKQEEIRPGQLKLLDRYEIWHTPDFDPHSREFVLFRKDLEKEMLFPYIVSLCKEFYQLQSQLSPIVLEEGAGYRGQAGKEGEDGAFECRHCLTQYIAAYGEPMNGVAAGTAFGQLTPDYVCPVCGASRSDFRAVEKSPLIQGRLS
jgi:rubredoxin